MISMLNHAYAYTFKMNDLHKLLRDLTAKYCLSACNVKPS